MKKRFTFMMAALALLTFLAVPMGMRGQTTSTTNASKVTSSSFTWTSTDENVSWSGTVNGGATNQNMNSGYAQIGTGGEPSTSVILSTSSVSGTITSVVINCAAYKGKATVSATVGGSAFGTQSQPCPSWSSNSGGDVTFSGNASGSIVVTMTNGTDGRAMYIKSIAVTYTSGPATYTVTYDCNGGTSGCPTENPTGLSLNDPITLAAAPSKPGHSFSGWNDGTTTYAAGADYTVTGSVTMTAQWTINTHDVTVQGNTHGTVTGYTNPVEYNTEVTLVYTHNEGEYYSATFASDNVTITNGTFTMPDNDVTITVTESALPVYTVTFSDSGSLTEAHYGAGVTLPNRSGDGIYTFAGWTTNNIPSETTTAPETILTGTYHPTENITLYPVYTRSEGGGFKWKKLTTLCEPDGEGTYAIMESTNKKAFNGTISSGHGSLTTGSFTFDENNEASSAPEGTCELTLTAVKDENDNILGFTMFNPNNKYLYASKAASGGLAWHESEDSYWYYATVSSIRRWIYNKEYSDKKAQLRYYHSTPSFRIYESTVSNGTTFCFVKKVSLATTYYISTLSSVALPTFDPESQNFSTASLTVTITANEGCLINYTTDGTDPKTSSTATTTESNSANVTVTETTTIRALAFDGDDFSAEVSQTYTHVYEVTLNSNGVAATPVEVVTGESTTLAAPANVPLGFSFRGWTATPATPSTLVSNTYTPNANVTLYAVFGKEIYGDFKKITSEPSNWDGFYLIVFETRNVALDGSLADNMDESKNTIDVEINNNVIATDETTNASKFEFASITGGYSIRSTSGYYIGRTANTNGLDMSATIPYLNILSYSSGPVITASGGPKLLCWSQGGVSPTWKISYYASSQNAIQLYKQEVVSTVGYYIQAYPTNSTTTATKDITITGPTVIESGSVLNMNGHTLANAEPANLIIEDGGQLICNNQVNATLQKEINAAEVWGVPGADAWYFIASPVDGYETSNVIITGTTDTDFYSFDEESGYWFNGQGSAHPFTTLNRGQGYLYANKTGDNLSFLGTMPATNTYIEKTLSFAGNGDLKGFNLMGNPFTCNLTNDNVKIQDGETQTSLTTYYIVENGTELATMELSSNPIKPGRGFLIQAYEDGQKLVFNPGAKRGETINKPSFIRIEAGNADFMDRAYVQFGQGNTLRKMTINDNVSHVYVMSDGKDYAAATIQEARGEMPVNFKAHRDGQYTITVNPQEVEMDYLHLVDNIAGVDVDLLANPSYTFNAKADDYESRFRLVFSANMVNADLNDDFAFFSNGQLVIANEGESLLQVIDVNGRIVTTESVSGTCSKAINVKAGVYVLRLIQGTDVKTQKIIVK